MKRDFVNYAFTTTMYSQKKNFLSTFSPFVLKALYELNRNCTDQEIIVFVKENYDLTIPINTIKSILNGLAKLNFVRVTVKTKSNWEGCISEAGKEEVEKYIENEHDVERRQNRLISALNKFLEENGVFIPKEELQAKTLNYIQSNLSSLAIFDHNGIDEKKAEDTNNEKLDEYITTFATLIESKEPELYTTFEELVKGAIIREHIENKTDSIEFGTIESLSIYLDTNIILSLFEFHHPSINSSAKQLFDLLSNDRKIKLKVFSFTLDEIERLLKSYRVNKDNYNPGIPVNSIFYYLRNKEFDDFKTDSFINALDHKISSLGIAVENCDFKNRNTFLKEEEELYKDIYSYKNDQNRSKPTDIQKDEEAIHLSALHDANVILAIRRKRGSWVKTLERSKAIFLTSSYLMDHFCKQMYRHHVSFPEVILDLTLTNILWLRNPNKEIGIKLHKLIAVHSKKIIIDNGIWTRFVKTLKELRSGGDIDNSQYAMLFSNNQLTVDYLQNVNIDEISPQSILNLSQRIEDEFKRKDEIIIEKEKTLKETEVLLKNEKITAEKLDKEKNEYKEKYDDAEELITSQKKQLEELQKKIKCDDYVNEKLQQEFYPLRNKIWFFALAIAIAFIFMFFAEVAEDTDFQKFRIPVEYRKQIKLIGFLYPIIFTLINYKKLWQSVRFHISNSKLKKEYETRFTEEFKQTNN